MDQRQCEEEGGKEEAEGPVTGNWRLIWYYHGRTACAVSREGVDAMTSQDLGS